MRNLLRLTVPVTVLIGLGKFVVAGQAPPVLTASVAGPIAGVGKLMNPTALPFGSSSSSSSSGGSHDITTLTGINITTLSGMPLRTIQ
jgi:hypothetical protein